MAVHDIITGMGFVPGCASGPLKRGLPAQPQQIVLINQAEIMGLEVLPAGLIVDQGAPFSHTLIGLLGSSVPTLILDASAIANIADGTWISVDGGCGELTVTADAASRTVSTPAAPALGLAATSRDGVPVQLRASVRSVAATRRAVAQGAAAIGLVRTEFFEPASGEQPKVQFFRTAFEEVCAAAAPLDMTFRLLDIAQDKRPAWLPRRGEDLGALGLQGVRLWNDPQVLDVVEAQLEAIAALAVRQNLQVLLPYLVRYEELLFWTEFVRQRLPRTVAVGAMIETPAGALELDNWFDAVDFIAIGCNDLMQCLFAADRDRPELRAYMDPYAPVLYRLFRKLANLCGSHLETVQLCGVLPQLQGVLPLLLGLGFRCFSVDSGQIPFLVQAVRNCDCREARRIAADVCKARTSAEVMERLGLPIRDDRSFVSGTLTRPDQQKQRAMS